MPVTRRRPGTRALPRCPSRCTGRRTRPERDAAEERPQRTLTGHHRAVPGRATTRRRDDAATVGAFARARLSVATAVAPDRRPAPAAVRARPCLVRGVVDLVLAVVTSIPLAAVAPVLHGLSTSTGNVTFSSLIQSWVREDLRGRAFAGFDLLWRSGRLLSLSAGGRLADRPHPGRARTRRAHRGAGELGRRGYAPPCGERQVDGGVRSGRAVARPRCWPRDPGPRGRRRGCGRSAEARRARGTDQRGQRRIAVGCGRCVCACACRSVRSLSGDDGAGVRGDAGAGSSPCRQSREVDRRGRRRGAGGVGGG